MLYQLDKTVTQVGSQLVSQSDWWCRLHYRSCQQGQRKLFYLWRAETSKETARIVRMCVCVHGSRKMCGKHLARSLAHMGTHGHVCIHKHTMANVKMYSLCMTNPNASAECTTLPPFLPKWKQGWISAEGPGPFTWDWCLSIWCIKIIGINVLHSSVSCALLKPSASAEQPQHTHGTYKS